MSDEAGTGRPERGHVSDPGNQYDECRACGKRRHEHSVLEQSGSVRHRFSEAGELVEVAPPGQDASATPAETRILVVPQPDLALRALLVSRGLLTQEEVDALRG